MGSRHEFRFVVDGVELSEEHREQIAAAVGEAGALALAGLTPGPRNSLSLIPRGWNGRWLLELELEEAEKLAAATGLVDELQISGLR